MLVVLVLVLGLGWRGADPAELYVAAADLVERRHRPDVALHDPDADVCVA